MAFVVNGAGDVISFAEYTDVVQKDQRIFEENNLVIPAESGFLTVVDFVENTLELGTQRILLKIKASTWWQAYNNYVGNTITDLDSLPNVNPTLIDPGNLQGRRQQFTDLCVYYTMKEYILPLVAEFELEAADMNKITYYDGKFNELFQELISMSDWYDFDNSGTVDTDEKLITYAQTRRSRSRRTIVKVR
tara:strand:+ start:7095 stop:7667 length:573 start_codon:yes stop_codon:yes gene_type:complete